MNPDPRVTLARGGAAAAELEGVLHASAYVEPLARRIVRHSANMVDKPDAGSELLDQALYGEAVDILTEEADFAFCRSRRNGHVGFVAADALGDPGPAPTHRVSANAAFGYAERDFKASALGPFGLNALVCVVETDGRYVRDDRGVWFTSAHLAPIGVFERDPAAVAARFVGVPYLWGGRDGSGLDCSGLVLQALLACGIGAPRDSDMQMALGAPADPTALRRGDLVFWKGHVGMMLDRDTLLHANTHHMAVAAEPLADAVTRIGEATSGQPIAYRRLPSLG